MTREQFLFALGPYLAAASCVAHGLVGKRAGARAVESATGASVIWRWAIAVVMAGHILALAFPAYVLAWNRQVWRLYGLEAVGFFAATLALAALCAVGSRRRRAEHAGDRTALHIVGDTVMFVAVATGAATGLRYRWASSWSAVTLAPYLSSLLRLDPDVALIAGMPALVRLHVLSGFAIVALLPHTPLAGVVSVPSRVIGEYALVPLLRTCVPLWRAVESWTLRCTAALRLLTIRDRGEEN